MHRPHQHLCCPERASAVQVLLTEARVSAEGSCTLAAVFGLMADWRKGAALRGYSLRV